MLANGERNGEEFYQLLRRNHDHLEEELPEIRDLKSVEDSEEYVRYKRVAWLSRKRLIPKIVEKSTGKMIGQLWMEPKWGGFTQEGQLRKRGQTKAGDAVDMLYFGLLSSEFEDF